MNRNWYNLLLVPTLLGLLCLYGCGSGTKNTQTTATASDDDEPVVVIVQITSNPSGAKVYLNEVEIGMTPFEATVEEREGDFSAYDFYVMKKEYVPGRRNYKEEFYYQDVTDVVPEIIHFELIERKKHMVKVTSDPVGAQIAVDGFVYGTTPHTLMIWHSIDEPRIYEIQAQKDGYISSVKTIEEVVVPEEEDEEAATSEEQSEEPASDEEKSKDVVRSRQVVFELPPEVHFVLQK